MKRPTKTRTTKTKTAETRKTTRIVLQALSDSKCGFGWVWAWVRVRVFVAYNVLNHFVGGEELDREVVLTDAGVGSREWVFPEAKGEHPDRRLVVDSGVGVEDVPATVANERVVGQQGEIVDLDEWGAHDAERDDQSR
ncbi:hypothetical protein AAC387_Pa06g0022 [Persea americana]